MNPECDEVTERCNNIEEFDDYTISRWFPRDEDYYASHLMEHRKVLFQLSI